MASNGIHGASKDESRVLEGRQGMSPVARVVDHFKRYWHLWVLVAPTMAFVGLFAYVPMYGIQLAFREYDPTKGLTGGQWVGLKYFKQFVTSPQFWNVLMSTFRVSLGTLILGFIVPIILALLINQIGNQKVKSFVQTVTYMPHFISTVVIVSMINIFLDPKAGVLGRVIGTRESIMDNPDLFAPIYWISEIWQHMGWSAIIYLAALSSVDLSLYEAAKIDGAGRLQLIRYVDIPTIMPTCVIMLIMQMGRVLSVGFEKVYLMQNALNLPGSQVISTFVYQIGMVNFQFSYSTAIGLFNTVVNFVFLIIANTISKRVSDTSIF